MDFIASLAASNPTITTIVVIVGLVYLMIPGLRVR